ncbi:MAG: hypothetical protein ACRENQ_05410, partial [Gemmatimonadaceae bacterium]
MGGDHAPRATVTGALLAAAELDPAHSIHLVGPSALIEQTLDASLRGEHAALASFRGRLRFVEAPE